MKTVTNSCKAGGADKLTWYVCGLPCSTTAFLSSEMRISLGCGVFFNTGFPFVVGTGVEEDMDNGMVGRVGGEEAA
jgi:hypothetical protein